jgi:hypothetical protein
MARRDAPGPADAVGVVADELYGLPLDNFTAARNERAKRARADGDSGTAAAIGKLAKPSTVAWLANQLVREHADEIRPLLELGESMRRATAALDAGQLRDLSRQQRQVVRALAQRAHRLANAAGQAVSDNTARGLEDTLHAALADEQAARQLSEGRLTAGLSRSGFPGIEPSAQEVAAPSAAARRRAKADRPAGTGPAGNGEAAARRGRAERARRDETNARGDAEEAVRNQEKARDALRQADRGVRETADNLERLQAELDAAQEARAGAVRAQRRAHKDADWAGRAARQAERRLQDATARRKNLEGERD